MNKIKQSNKINNTNSTNGAKTTLLSYKYLPNCITAVRIVGTAAMLFMKPLSKIFLIVYAVAGFTDVLDGFIARKMGTISDFGSKLDSVADLLLYFVMLVKLFPVMWVVLPNIIWAMVGAIVVVRFCAYMVAAKKYKRFSAQHTYMNKASGLAVFTVPFAIVTAIAVPYCWGVCVVAMTASLEELIIHLTSKEYNPSRKTLLMNKN